MQVDWFTVGAQIVNFLILVFLLKRFLYGPVIRAMDARQKKVTDRLREAEEREEAADERQRELEEKRRDLDRRREDMLDEARQSAEGRRRELLVEIREETEAHRERWRRELDQERETFLRELRSETASWVARAARRALRDLASAELEAQMISVLQKRIGELDTSQREQLIEAARSSEEPFALVTTFELGEEQREALRSTLEDVLDASIELRFAESADLVCGVELRTPSTVVSWSVDAFTDDLAERIDERLRGAAREDGG